jgi:hypothetical protein
MTRLRINAVLAASALWILGLASELRSRTIRFKRNLT